MRFFLESARPEEAKKVKEWGLLDGVSVPPAAVAAEAKDYRQVVREMSAISDGPVFAEVESSDAKGMYKEGREYHKLGKDVVVKLPMTPDGVRVVRLLSQDQIAVNVSLCFSAAQALIVGKGGAAYVSPFVGRLDDIGAIGMDLIEQIIRIYDNYGFQTLVVVESVRNPVHVLDSALMGADVATIPFAIIDQLFRHPLTESGLAQLARDWEPASRKQS
jgi:transaldolase